MVPAAVASDTHRFVERLTRAGMDERQSEVLAGEQATLLNTNLATRSEIATVVANLQARLAEVEANLLRWMVGALVARAGVIVGLLRPSS